LHLKLPQRRRQYNVLLQQRYATTARARLNSNLIYRGVSTQHRRSLFTVSIGVGCICAWWMSSSSSTTSGCEALMVVTADDNNHIDHDKIVATSSNGTAVGIRMKDNIKGSDDTPWSRIRRALRMIRRILKLTIVFTPVVALYPLHWMTWYLFGNYVGSDDDNNNITDAHDIALRSISFNGDNSLSLSLSNGWYYRLCLWCVEYSGAACIKIMQWAGSRPDMFGQEFCAVFSKLQDSTKTHSWKHTKAAMKDAYGDDWEDKIKLGKNDILGSGCIAQVYKATVIMDDDDDDYFDSESDFDNKNSKKYSNVNGNGKKKERPMAVKVMHPNVEDDIDADLDILRLTVRILEHTKIGPVKNLKWLNLPGFIEEMAIMLKTQLDLRTEGENLRQFNNNFAEDEKNQTTIFPKIVEKYPPTKGVLMETFMEGQPVMEFIRSNKADQKLMTEMCTEAIRAVCQMLFLDNFTHGDMHPGNVLVTNDYKFVLLDVGITTIHSESDHRLVSDILTAFIRCDGRKAGRLMIDDSNRRLGSFGDHSIDEEKFIDKIEELTIRAQGKDYFMEHLGAYITHICQSAATHHVMVNQAFMSAALAVKVMEGIALALDPTIEIWKIAIPVIMEGERKNGRTAERAKEIIGGRFVNWFTSNKNSEEEKQARMTTE